MTRIAIAVIMPPSFEGGYEWGMREHVLIRSPDDLRQILGEYAGDLPTDPEGMLDVIVSSYPGADAAIVDLDEEATDEWPTMGDAEAWPNDIWLGMADYLSASRWASLLGRPVEYDLSDEVASRCVSASGRDQVIKAIEYLDVLDPIYATITRACGIV